MAKGMFGYTVRNNFCQYCGRLPEKEPVFSKGYPDRRQREYKKIRQEVPFYASRHEEGKDPDLVEQNTFPGNNDQY